MSKEHGSLSINSENIFPVIKKWLYSDHDIFYRELVSNACDAITKLKKLDGMGEVSLPDDNEFKVQVIVNPDEKTIKVIDNGIGMTEAEVKEYINQIAFSGAASFLEKYKDKTSDDQIIGHFGLGFYSAFMVADKVTIDTLSFQDGAKGVHWESEGGVDFEMTDSDRAERGTEITLYLNEDSFEFANEYRAKEVLDKYCSFMPVPIFFSNATTPIEEEKEEEKEENNEEIDNDVIDATVDENGKATTEEKKDEKKEPKKPAPINTPNPLWKKNPSECTDEEYKKFYQEVFHDYKEPLFWIHLNMDYPFNLKGILYFPKLNTEYDQLEGTIKLYCDQVFIADNIKEVIPEWLMLLKGVIDCPDLPLNVSRSALQNDGFVKKISDYITKKVADKLTGMYKVDRENYEKYWDDISPFIKFGCLKDDKFREKMESSMLFKNLEGKYVTLNEYVEANKAAKKDEKAEDAKAEETKAEETKAEDAKPEDAKTDDAAKKEDAKAEDKKEETDNVFYVTDEIQQSQYINMFKAEGVDALILTHNIDQPFITNLEQHNKNLRFFRIDADVNEAFKNTDGLDADAMKKETDDLTALFRKVLNNDKLEVKVENLKNENVSSMVTLSEESRRMQDMMRMYNMSGMNPDMFSTNVTLVLNTNNALVKYVYEHKDAENINMFCEQLYDLALISHKQLDPDAMTKFINRSNEIMLLLAK